MLKFNLRYFIFTIFFLIAEILIALFINDNFIRPYFGDVLVVILIYCFIKSFITIRPLYAATFVLAFSFFIEFLQYLNFIEIIGLENSKLMSTILGNSFAWNDIAAYIIGAIIVIIAEKIRLNDRPTL